MRRTDLPAMIIVLAHCLALDKLRFSTATNYRMLLEPGRLLRKIRAVVGSTALFASQRAMRNQPQQNVNTPEFVQPAAGLCILQHRSRRQLIDSASQPGAG